MKRAKVNKVKCFSLCVYDCIRRKPEGKRWMPNEWKRSEGKTHGGKDCVRREWMSEKNTVTNLRYCRQTPICGSSLWKLWLLSESSDWSTLRDKLLDFFSGGSSDSTIQNKELFCVGIRKFRFTINANHKISFLLFKRHAMKRRVVPLCLFLRQLVSLFPDRTAVLNSSWDLLSSIPKITTIKNSFTDWEALAAFIVPKQKWMFALKQTVPFLTSLQRRLRGFNKMSAVIPACETHPEGNIPCVNFFHALSQGRASNVMIYPLA